MYTYILGSLPGKIKTQGGYLLQKGFIRSHIIFYNTHVNKDPLK